jgi:hypothetical protein
MSYHPLRVKNAVIPAGHNGNLTPSSMLFIITDLLAHEIHNHNHTKFRKYSYTSCN